MRYVIWFVKIVLFLLLFAFSLRNTTPVTVHGLLDSAWQAPLIVFLLIFFVAGAALGALVMSWPLVRARRRLAELRRQQRQGGTTGPATPEGVEPAAPLDAVL